MSDSDTAEMLLLLTNGGGEGAWDAQTSTAAMAKWTAMRAPKWGNCNAHGRCALTAKMSLCPRAEANRLRAEETAAKKAPPKSTPKKSTQKKHPPSPLCGGGSSTGSGQGANVPAARQVPAMGLPL